MVSLVIRPLISLPRIAPFTESTDISLPSEEAQGLPQGRPLVRPLSQMGSPSGLLKLADHSMALLEGNISGSPSTHISIAPWKLSWSSELRAISRPRLLVKNLNDLHPVLFAVGRPRAA